MGGSCYVGTPTDPDCHPGRSDRGEKNLPGDFLAYLVSTRPWNNGLAWAGEGFWSSAIPGDVQAAEISFDKACI